MPAELPREQCFTRHAYRHIIWLPGMQGVGGALRIGRHPVAVVGIVPATTLSLSNSPATARGPGTYGTIKIVNGRQYTCRTLKALGKSDQGAGWRLERKIGLEVSWYRGKIGADIVTDPAYGVLETELL